MSTDFKKLTPREVRALAEANKLDTATGALCPDYVKASLLILPSTYADDFSALPPGTRKFSLFSRSYGNSPSPPSLRPGPISALPCRATASLSTARSPRM